MLTNREVDPLDDRGVDLPAVRGEHLLDSLEGAEHHAMAHMDQTPPAYSLDHLRIAQPGQGHPTGLGHWALCLPASWLYPVPIVREQCRRVRRESVRQEPRDTAWRQHLDHLMHHCAMASVRSPTSIVS